jgi:hypothetical protein
VYNIELNQPEVPLNVGIRKAEVITFTIVSVDLMMTISELPTSMVVCKTKHLSE